MSHLAQRRDIHDADVVVQFAVEVGSLQRLRMLYVLTCSDLAAVGPGVLNDWKQDLITQLYLHARECLAGEGISAGFDERLAKRRAEIRAWQKTKKMTPWWNTQIEGHAERVSVRCSVRADHQRTQTTEVLPHNDAVAWGRWLPDRNAVEYTIGAYEEITPGIFHKLTGALASKRMQILSAEIHTLADNLVLDRFYVHDLDFAGEPPAERSEKSPAALVAALKDKSGKPPTFSKVWRSTEKFVDDAVKLPTQVRIDNVSSDRFTIIDIFRPRSTRAAVCDFPDDFRTWAIRPIGENQYSRGSSRRRLLCHGWNWPKDPRRFTTRRDSPCADRVDRSTNCRAGVKVDR